MAWSNKQKQLAMRACLATGISEEQRRDMILCNFANAHFRGDISSTSPRLTNRDFESFMAIVERYAGGQLLHFTRDFWQRASAGSLSRMRYHAQRVASVLENHGKLIADGVGLAGWIEKRVSGGDTRRLDELDYHRLLGLILGLEAYVEQNKIRIDLAPAAAVA